MTPTMTTTTTPSVTVARRRRRQTTSCADQYRPKAICNALPHSVDALDLSPSSLTPTLASLRLLILSYLADLETRLSEFESPLSDLDVKIETAAESLMTQGELSVEEARAWARVGLEMLEKIRSDVQSYLPEWHFDLDTLSVESILKSHLPDLPDLNLFLDDMRARLPDFDFSIPASIRSKMEVAKSRFSSELDDVRARLPDMNEVRSHLSDIDLVSDIRTRFSELDFQSYPRPLNYIPTLSAHLDTLHSHLSSLSPSSVPVSVSPSTRLVDILNKLSTQVIPELVEKGKESLEEGEDMLERATKEVKDAIKRSFNGNKLIHYCDLPQKWRNNQHVNGGYRFIPLERWPLIVLSLFALHNETLNIHTHLIPFLLWLPSVLSSLFYSLPSFSLPLVSATSFSLPLTSHTTTTPPLDGPELTFLAFALVCLFCSTVWHTMSGCAHPKGMDICARVDYVGIGWLISASVGTVVYYGFRDHPEPCVFFLGFSFFMGVVGSILPFSQWFNERKHKNKRIVFFVALAASAVAPLTWLSFVYGTKVVIDFITPVFPSIVSYLVGLSFYATHFPECLLSSSPLKGKWIDWVGGGSHAIWHAFIVLAIWQHREAMRSLREGLPGIEGLS
ncbi:hypothetical protein JAAARDRAFT_177509 [Jaapia argillacea MUCL 33604]|uniref:HlyIII-domain-containing protein n=1 Tax=Jaapia argillacea MUCL 33604 TaxID=933084 RepID=A0A067Q1M0_9AGAM|nr:hypothetical protein JAAARDRAFT_177509 [Jaapia argillacea MUCL 33604]